MEQENKDRIFFIVLFFLALSACVPRIILAAAKSIRLEEALQWVLTTRLSDALESTQPPFYTILLAGWIRIFGDNLFALRSLSIIAGCAGVVFIGLLAKRAAGHSFGIITALLFATNPLMAYIGSYATPYSMLIALSLAGFLMLVMMLDSGKADPLVSALFSGIVILGVFTHFYYLLILLLMILYFGLFRAKALADKDIKKQITLSLCIPLVIFLLYTPIALSQVKTYLHQNELFQSAVRFPSPVMVGWFSDVGAGAPIMDPGWVAPLFLAGTFALLGFGAVLSVLRRRNVDSVVSLLFMGSFIFALAVSTAVPIINEHLIWFLTPGALLLVALGMMGLKKVRWAVAALFAGIAILGFIVIGQAIWKDNYFWKSNADWNSLVKKIGEEYSANAEVLIDPAWFSAQLIYHSERNELLQEKLDSPLPMIQVISGKTMSPEIDKKTKRIFCICAEVVDCKGIHAKLLKKDFVPGKKFDFTGITLTEYRISNSNNPGNEVANDSSDTL